jgi:catechol 2,3-dioxygenase-like lactoylglutathione lyase family enzyme
MENFYARAVFFVRDAPAALIHYTQHLGFNEDWNYQENGRAHVVQVSLHGFELILNQTEEPTQTRAGQGRVFIGLSGDQAEALRQHWTAQSVEPVDTYWGKPTQAIIDPDGNQLLFWMNPG